MQPTPVSEPSQPTQIPNTSQPNNTPSTQFSSAYHAQQLQDDVQDLQSLFTHVNSYSICHATGRIAVNVPQGLAIVNNGLITKYYEDSNPFRGKTGVKLSSILPYSSLIAVVPESTASVVPDAKEGKLLITARTVTVNPFTVYVYDLSSKSHIYQKDFNSEIESLKITKSYIAVGNSKRVVFLDYRKDLQRNSLRDGNKLKELIEGYKKGKYDESARYVEIEGTGDFKRGQIKSSLQQPVRFAFIKQFGKTLSIFDTDLNIFIDIQLSKQDRDFCLSPDGKYLAIISQGGIDIKILQIATRTIFTEYKRGATIKQIACFGFCEPYFGFASKSAASATFHFFPLKRKEAQEVIYSQYKRYFNTFREPVDFFVVNRKVYVFSQVGCGFVVLDLERATKKRAEDGSREIRSQEVVMWKCEESS